jgi:hypothetical protein
LLGGFEILVFVALALTLTVQAGSDNTLQVFGTKYEQPRLLRLLRCHRRIDLILAFIGFEEVAPIAKRARAAHCEPAIIFSRPASASWPSQHLRQHHHVRTGEDDRLRQCRDEPLAEPAGWDAWGTVGFVIVFIALINSVITTRTQPTIVHAHDVLAVDPAAANAVRRSDPRFADAGADHPL